MKRTIIRRRKSIACAWMLLLAGPAALTMAQVPAFPGAEGFGAMATGGRGGTVVLVTNLNDSGPGSLRRAVESPGTRTVVFRVSGTIELQSELRITSGNLTIAGQTAPGEGICVRNFPLTIDADNVVIRFIRSRLGDEMGAQDDAMWGREHQKIIIDHCSMSWSVDECGSFYDNQEFTLQYCILSESLWASIHDKGNHGYGGIWGGQGATFHHNLLAHHTSRNPRFCGSRYTGQPDLELVDHRNNVIYNWGGNSCYGGEAGNHNMVANYYKYGPATSSSVRDRIVNPDQNENGYGYYYIADNVTHGYPATTEDNWRGVDGVSETVKDQIRLSEPLEAPALTPHTAYEAFEHVLAYAGAVLPARDPVDARIVQEALTGTATYGGTYGDGRGIIDTPGHVGGWPVLDSTEAPADTDLDGMPDAWEDAMGLDKTDPADRNGDLSGNGYTNLEDYLNSLVEDFEYLVRPVQLAIDSTAEHTVYLSWKDISDNETGFVLERKEGDGDWSQLTTAPAGDTVFVDENISFNGLYSYRMKAVNASMESWYTDSVTVNLNVGIGSVPPSKTVFEVFPNPVSGPCSIRYRLSEASRVDLSVLDPTGKRVLQLDQGFRTPGEYRLELDGNRLEQGVYLVRFTAGQSIQLHKIIKTR